MRVVNSPGRGRAVSNLLLVAILLLVTAGVWRTMAGPAADGDTDDVTMRLEVEGPVPARDFATITVESVALGPTALHFGLTFGTTLVLVETGSIEARWYGDDTIRLAGPGETVQLPAGSTFSIINSGDSQATLLLLRLNATERSDSGPDSDVGVRSWDFVGLAPTATARVESDTPQPTFELIVVGYFDDAMPNGAVVSLRRTLVRPNASLEVPPSSGLSWVGWVDGRLELTFSGAPAPYRFETDIERESRFRDDFHLTAGMSLRARNTGDMPVVVYVVDVIPQPAVASST